MGRDAWGQEVGGRPLLTIERRGGGKEEGHGEELMAIPPIQKLKMKDGVRKLLAAPNQKEGRRRVRRMLAAPQPTRKEKERRKQSMGSAGRPPSNEKTRRSRNPGWAWAAPPLKGMWTKPIRPISKYFIMISYEFL